MSSDLFALAFGRNHLWLGGQLIEDKWQWVGRVTGPILYSFWSDSEPNSKGVEKCLETNQDFTWNDNLCSSQYQYALCEKVP